MTTFPPPLPRTGTLACLTLSPPPHKVSRTARSLQQLDILKRPELDFRPFPERVLLRRDVALVIFPSFPLPSCAPLTISLLSTSYPRTPTVFGRTLVSKNARGFTRDLSLDKNQATSRHRPAATFSERSTVLCVGVFLPLLPRVSK